MFTAISQQPSTAPATASPVLAYGGRDRRRSVAAAFDPVYVGRFVWRWRRFAVASGALGLALGLVLVATTPKTYLASTSVLLDPRDLKVVQNEVAPNALPSDATLALIESQTAVATSDRVLSAVIAKADLAHDPEFNGEHRTGLLALVPNGFWRKARGPAEEAVLVGESLRRAMTVVREQKSFIINLSVKTESAEKSARLANLVADSFIAEIGRIQSDTARRATVALSSRLSELRQAVAGAESRVEDYKTTNALIGVAGKLVDDEYITRANDQLARVRADITALRVKAGSLREASVDDVVKGGLPEEVNSEALMRLRQSYADLASQASSLATRLGPRHPQRIAIDGALATARDSIRRELARIVGAGQTELARAETTERDLTGQIDELKAKQVLTSGAFVKLRELEREVEASRAVYEAFLLRARETSEQEGLNTANVRIISEAVPPIRSSGPSRKLLAVAGGLGGLALGAALVAAVAMLRLLSGFLRQDRRGGERAAWTEADRAAHRAAADETARAEDGARAAGAVREDAMPETAAAASVAAEETTPTIPAAETVAVPAFLSFDAKDVPADPNAAAPASAEGVARAPSRRASRSGADRAALREKLRAMAAPASAETSSDPAGPAPEAELIDRQLRSVRDALAELRGRRFAGA